MNNKTYTQILSMLLAFAMVLSMAGCAAAPGNSIEIDPTINEQLSVIPEESGTTEESDYTNPTEIEECTKASESTTPEETPSEATEQPETEPKATTPTETAPPSTEAPAITQPTEAQPVETRPTETQPAETQPTVTTPSVTEPPATEVPAATVPTEPESHTHTYKSTVVNPTCTDGGYTLYECDCGDNYTSDATPALSTNYQHRLFDQWYVTKEPTTESEGEKVRYCQVCGYAGDVQIIEKLDEDAPPNDVLDVGVLIAYGNSYAESLGFTVVSGTLPGYYPASWNTFKSMEDAKTRVAGKVYALYQNFMAYDGTIEGARVSVSVVDNGDGSFSVTVYYG